MKHDEIVAEIQRRARRRGVLTHYCCRGIYCRGDNGLPDLVCVGPHGCCWVEVKTPNDRLRPDQVTWKHALRAAGQDWFVVRGADLLNGVVDGILDGLGSYSSVIAPSGVA